jgi:hypothetical protein
MRSCGSQEGKGTSNRFLCATYRLVGGTSLFPPETACRPYRKVALQWIMIIQPIQPAFSYFSVCFDPLLSTFVAILSTEDYKLSTSHHS